MVRLIKGALTTVRLLYLQQLRLGVVITNAVHFYIGKESRFRRIPSRDRD